MASYCPKCNYKLALTDMKAECPVCGVNLLYYGVENRLKEEADKAEYEHALLQPRIDRLKSATIGSPMAIVRLVVTLLPMLATLIPFGSVTHDFPFHNSAVTVNLVAVIKDVFMDLDIGYYFDMFSDPLLGRGYLFEFAALICLVLVLLCALVNDINLLISGGKRAIPRNVTVAAVGLCATIAGAVCFSLSVSAFNKAIPELYSGKVIVWGILVTALMFIAVIAVNLIYKKMDIPVKYTDVSELLLSADERKKTEDNG